MTTPATPRRIGISLGNIGALHDGLGEFALQIGQRIAAAAPAWREAHGVAFEFHLRERLFGLFGPEVAYRPVSRWQRLRHVTAQPFALWHSLHQLNKNRPPQGCSIRVVTVHDLNYRVGRNAFSTWRHHRRTMAAAMNSTTIAVVSGRSWGTSFNTWATTLLSKKVARRRVAEPPPPVIVPAQPRKKQMQTNQRQTQTQETLPTLLVMLLRQTLCCLLLWEQMLMLVVV